MISTWLEQKGLNRTVISNGRCCDRPELAGEIPMIYSVTAKVLEDKAAEFYQKLTDGTIEHQ